MANCEICGLPDEVRVQIDQKLRAGVGKTKLERDYSVSRHSLTRHFKSGHHFITKAVKKRRTSVKKTAEKKVIPQDKKLPAEYIEQDGVVKSIYHVLHELEIMFNNSKGSGTYKATLEIAKVMKGFHELSAKIEGLIREGQVNILVSPGWVSLQTDILEALREYPEARQAVLDRLKSHHNDAEGEYEEVNEST